MNKYGFSVLWSDEDECYVVTCKDFPEFSAFGDTKDEALAEANVALDLLISAYVESGKSLPEPSVVSTERYSGQLRLRMPPLLHENLVHAASSQGVSLNAWIVYLLTERNAFRDLIEKIGNLEQSLCNKLDVIGSKSRLLARGSRFELEQVVDYEQDANGGLYEFQSTSFNERSKTYSVQLPN